MSPADKAGRLAKFPIVIPCSFTYGCVGSNDVQQTAAQLTEGRNLASELGGRNEGTLSNTNHAR